MLTTRGAVLLALRHGPSYGRELVRRVLADSDGRVRLAGGGSHAALQRLEGGRLLRSWTVVPGKRRGGRARRYYELTLRGIHQAEAALSGLAALLQSHGTQLSLDELERVRRRVELAAELSETALLLGPASSRRVAPGSRA